MGSITKRMATVLVALAYYYGGRACAYGVTSSLQVANSANPPHHVYTPSSPVANTNWVLDIQRRFVEDTFGGFGSNRGCFDPSQLFGGLQLEIHSRRDPDSSMNAPNTSEFSEELSPLKLASDCCVVHPGLSGPQCLHWNSNHQVAGPNPAKPSRTTSPSFRPPVHTNTRPNFFLNTFIHWHANSKALPALHS
ncbi:hypothetical protein BD410DRAFT_827418 [Rickenella mellea]|uniref:Uncharacterized protein n=1 Tax=Rickenella mellea TaxID=50990 RepID=A0A4Y7Q8H0_9AGAM|nr:hypothetical protein BD410DRAFT_827418 [Rickenella mellea]